jgi:mannan endo-1,4-beta-mannosidase
VTFIGSDGATLLRDGRPWRFVLANAYYLQDEIGQGAPAHADAALDDAVALGAAVVRAWAFNDNPDKMSRMWNGLDQPVEAGFVALDRAVAAASRRGLRLILALHDYWPSYGGIAQWLRWRGVEVAPGASPTSYADRFYGDSQLRDAYRLRVTTLLDRRNSVSGVRYGDDPTVLAWELMNEARQAPADWVSFAAGCVRSRARQLVSLGDEEARDSPDLDLASLHFYPEKQGAAVGDEERFGLQRITQAAHHVTRPLIVGELGISSGRLPLAERRQIYGAWFECARELGVAGIGPWMLAYAGREPDSEGFSYYRGGEYDGIIGAAVADLA